MPWKRVPVKEPLPVFVLIVTGTISLSKCPAFWAASHLCWDVRANSSCTLRLMSHCLATFSAANTHSAVSHLHIKYLHYFAINLASFCSVIYQNFRSAMTIKDINSNVWGFIKINCIECFTIINFLILPLDRYHKINLWYYIINIKKCISHGQSRWGNT